MTANLSQELRRHIGYALAHTQRRKLPVWKMAQPTPSDVHIDTALTDMSIAYIQAQTNYVAGMVFPAKPVEHQTNKYHIFTTTDWFRDDAVVRRAPGQGAPRAGFTLSNDSYSCVPWWTACPLSELVRSNADPAVSLDEACMRIVTQRMLIRRERLFATAFMDTDSVWDTDLTGSTGFTQWDDSSSDPEKDIQTGKKAVLLATGFEPRKLTVAYNVHMALKRHPLVKDRFKYTSAASITNEMLAAFFELDQYNVTKAVYDTAVEGGSASMAMAVGNHAILTGGEDSPDLMTPVAATNFVWSGLTSQNDLGVRIDQFYDPDRKEDVVRGEFAFDMKVTGAVLGYRYKNAVSA